MSDSKKPARRRVEARTVPPIRQRRPGREVVRSIFGYDKVWFTRHALQRMKERGVTESQVFFTLEHPTTKGLRTQGGRERWRRGLVDVVFERLADHLCIVTVIKLTD